MKINGTEYRFGHEPMSYDFSKHCYPDDNLPSFWKSGGCCGFGIDENGETDYGDEIVGYGDWELADCTEDEFPEDVKALLPEILKCMNENAPHGCCGGCN